METRQRFLSRVIGHLRIEERREEFADLQELLARSDFPETPELGGSPFSFEGADLFSPEGVAPAQREAIAKLEQLSADPEFRVSVRQGPVRSTQLRGAVPLWAGGASAERTLGPFVNRDGRSFWFDFFRIEKLVALYVQGVPEPALLFKIRTGFLFFDFNLPLAADARSSYRLNAGSIWINSRLLASSAPAGFFTGLTIGGGSITLSVTPQVVDNRLTIAPNTTVRVQLQLRQQKVNDADPTSVYGQDARAALVELPQEFAFHFTGGKHALDLIGGASWSVYGHEADFEWRQQQTTSYDLVLNRVLIPLAASTDIFEVRDNRSPFHTFAGETKIAASFWALPAAALEVAHPTAAEGIGALVVRGEKGLTANWTALKGGPVNLLQPYVMAAPGRIAISDLSTGNAFAQQDFELWTDKLNLYGTTAKVQYLSTAPFFFNTLASGVEMISTFVNADVRADRPVTAKGEALEIRSKKSLLIIGATSAFRFVNLFDDNILADNLDPTKKPPQLPKPLSLVLTNALFKTTAVNGCTLVGTLAEDFVKIERGFLFLTLGLQAYLPTLPDPYAANIGQLRPQFHGNIDRSFFTPNQPSVWALLVCLVRWEPSLEVEEDEQKKKKKDKVEVSFHFAPLPNQPPFTPANMEEIDFLKLTGADPNAGVEAQSHAPPPPSPTHSNPLPDYDGLWKKGIDVLPADQFALLDVSTNADLLGVSFGSFGGRRVFMLPTLQVKGMEVVSQGMNVRAFTVPQISWEPVINLTDPVKPTEGDPPYGANYYPDDGGATRMLNNSADQVALAPLPLTDFLVENFATKKSFAALSLFTLPFGMRALALLKKNYGVLRGANLGFNAKTWADSGVTGGRQLQIDGGQSMREDESDMFMGSTVQVNNILDLYGNNTGASTLGAEVTPIFNNEFLLEPFQIIRQRGVPLTRMDWSGYGASIFSNWLNPKAALAETSQAKFDVFVGRCAHEIIQVVSILYPWGIKVVRTITLFREKSGYCYRFDTGWRAESEGLFDFTYYVYVPKEGVPGVFVPKEKDAGYPIHPGVVRGLFQVKNIRDTTEVEPFKGSMKFPPSVPKIVDGDGKEIPNDNRSFSYELRPVFFDADVLIENPVSGFITKVIGGVEKKLVPSKRILGFVQIAPRGIPLSVDTLKALLARQGGTIGGQIDSLVDIAGSGQQMRLSRFDLSNSFDSDGAAPAFAGTGRGSVLLPKDGSWSLVKHEFGTGVVSPVPQDLSAPLIRAGRLSKIGKVLQVLPDPANPLLRIANPTELLRKPANDTINYGFLQSTDTQKALFLTPAFQKDVATLMSKTPPLFADAFRIVNSKGIFPNIGNAVTNFGDVISLLKNGNEFKKSGLKDAGTDVLELMQIHDGVDAAKKEGYKLLKKIAGPFTLPTAPRDLINLGGIRIYLDYKADKIQGPKDPAHPEAPPPTRDALGALDFDVNSFAGNVADQWKSRMSDVAVVVDLGPINRLMTIKGSWDAKKGAEAAYGGSATDADFPSPQIEFAEELEPVIQILQILQDLQSANYKDAFKSGLKLAMSNKAGSWEYKLEASKEIPVVKFPMPPFDNDPNAPLKLEAGLRLGMYFNAALKVTSDPKDLLPSAGAFLGFYGRLSIMCVSVSIGTVYAVGQVTLDIAADSKAGPTLHMKFGFGAQIVIGLPVVGNVSVLYMVGVEMYTDSTQLNVSAFMLYQGHAEILGGLIGVTITIEAKGTIKRLTDSSLSGGGRTDLEAQVTFGLDISIFFVIDISFSTSWSEARQIA